ncbi:MAG: hypothetical protein U1E18_06385 [Brevundimonas sp.]|uniref:hypothetical protein n=1 Tax=Brevundimonas sp. TaxID=1871086 RepID=UPI002AB8CDE8|nr:hypothetical protein [Brevundimonas sp.]MDZ4109214.1 hypothetical protein [Brevundimonas sp.]
MVIAAWVQAIGSIAAIIAAIGVSWLQQRNANRLHRRQFELARRERVSGIGGLLEVIYVELLAASSARHGDKWYSYIISQFDREKFRRAIDALDRAPLHELGNWRIVTACTSAKEAAILAADLLSHLQDQNRQNPSRLSDEDAEQIYKLFEAVNGSMAPIVRALAYDYFEVGPISEWKEFLDFPDDLIPRHLRPRSLASTKRALAFDAVRRGIRRPKGLLERCYAAWHWRSIRKNRDAHPQM